MAEAADLQQMIQSSRLLTQQEREFWMQMLPRMHPSQRDRLRGILERAGSIQWTKALENVVAKIASAAQQFAVHSPSR